MEADAKAEGINELINWIQTGSNIYKENSDKQNVLFKLNFNKCLISVHLWAFLFESEVKRWNRNRQAYR